MTLETIIADRADDSVTLTYDRTISRKLVHRAAVSEVFLTDIRAIDERTVMIGAQLPRCHGYFHDHAKWRTDIDPLLLFEVSRQATLGSAHALDVPQDTILISSDFGMEILDINAFSDQTRPTAVEIENIFDWTAMRRGKPRAGICKQRIFVNGVVAATHWSSGQLMSHAQLEALREEQRGDAPPWTAQMTDRPDGVALQPHEVGRYNPLNVVLARLEQDGDALRANVAPPWQNRALFDHSYDHLTMQILTEAARQLAMVALSRGPFAHIQQWGVNEVSGTFTQFAEIDLPVVMHTKMPKAPAGPVVHPVVLPVSVIQAGQEIATLELVLTPDAKGTST
jgi:hypothetical protein